MTITELRSEILMRVNRDSGLSDIPLSRLNDFIELLEMYCKELEDEIQNQTE